MTRFTTVGSQLSVSITDSSDLGESRRAAKQLAEGFGFDDTQVTRICTIAAEIATNILKHATSGSVLLQVLDDGFQPEFEVLGIDAGPGMTDVDQCMRDGYSTRGSAGTGLGAMSRLSTTFDLFSVVDQGTVILARLGRSSGSSAPKRLPRKGFELGAISVPAAGELECGDAWRTVQEDGLMAILLIDGSGSGSLAAAASRSAVSTFMTDPFGKPATNVARIHQALAGTAGAAGACLMLKVAESKAEYAAIGSIRGAIVSDKLSQDMISQNGMLGQETTRPRQLEYTWPADNLAIVQSSGISAPWRLADYPGLSQHHPAVIAGVLFRDNVGERDDATIVVTRYAK